jgi:hypothetical protein
MVFALIAALGLAALARFANDTLIRLFMAFVGLFSVFYAGMDVWSDVFRVRPDAVTDATMLAAATGVPSVIWGGGWLLAGAALVVVFRRSIAVSLAGPD